MKKGTKVRTISGQLGLMSERDGSRFVSDTLNFGDEAEYDGPHDNPDLAEKGWDVLKVQRGSRTLWCPVHDGQYEPVAGVNNLRSLLR